MYPIGHGPHTVFPFSWEQFTNGSQGLQSISSVGQRWVQGKWLCNHTNLDCASYIAVSREARRTSAAWIVPWYICTIGKEVANALLLSAFVDIYSGVKNGIAVRDENNYIYLNRSYIPCHWILEGKDHMNSSLVDLCKPLLGHNNHVDIHWYLNDM